MSREEEENLDLGEDPEDEDEDDASGKNAVVQALTAVIVAQQATRHDPTPTEYFAVITSTLGSDAQAQSHQLADLLKFYSEVIPKSNRAIVRQVYSEISMKLLHIAAACGEEQSHAKILKYSLLSLGLLGCHQESNDSVWNSIHALKSINAFLTFVEAPNEKIKKVAQDGLVNILALHKKQNYKNVAKYVFDFVIEIFKGCTRSEYKRSLSLVTFLQRGLPYFTDKQVMALFEASMKLQACEQPLLSAAVFRVVDQFFQSRNCTLGVAPAKQILNFLITHKPLTEDMEANCWYYSSIASSEIYLNHTSAAEGSAIMATAVTALIRGFETEWNQIHCASADSIRRIMSACFVQSDIVATMAMADPSSSHIYQVVSSLDAILHLRYQQSWVTSLECFNFLMQKLNRAENKFYLFKYLVKLSDIYHAIELGSLSLSPVIKNKIQHILGTALINFGVVAFLEAVPLTGPEDPSYIGINDTREWVLVILRNNLKDTACTLADFGNTALKFAQNCSVALKNPASIGINVNSMSESETRQLMFIRNRVIQFWSLFPQYCVRGPTDIVSIYPRMSAVFDECISDTTMPEVSLEITKGISKLIQGCKAKYNIVSVANLKVVPTEITTIQQSNIFIVTFLLNFLDSISISDERFRPIVDDLTEMISISSADLIGRVAKKLLECLLSTHEINEESERNAASWMTTLLAIVNYLPQPVITIFHRTIRPYLSQNVSDRLQKRAFKVLDTLVQMHSEVVFSIEPRAQLMEGAASSIPQCHVSARGIRLAFLKTLMGTITDPNEFNHAAGLLMMVILACIKDANQKTRDSAVELLRFIIQNSPSGIVYEGVISVLNSESPAQRSAVLLVLSLLMSEKRNDNDLLVELAKNLPGIVGLMQDPSTGALSTPEQIKSVLTFVKLATQVFPLELLQEVLVFIVNSFTKSLGTEQGKYAIYCRSIVRKLVRRVDKAQLRALIPENEQQLLNHVLRMSRRALRKKEMAAKKDRMEELLDSDEESDEDNMTLGGGPESKGPARPKGTRAKDFLNDLQEDILDDDVNIVINKAGKVVKTANIDDSGAEDDYDVNEDEGGRLTVNEKKRGRGNEEDADEAEEAPKKGTSYNRPGEEKVNSNKRFKRAPGEEYKSKKAGGDVWKKGMLRPHAFIPLDPKLLTTKKARERGIAVMSSVVNHGSGAAAAPRSAKVQRQHLNRKQRESKRKHKK